MGLVIAAVSAIGFATLSPPEPIGFAHDDGVYAIMARALAAGDGPRMLHEAGAPWGIVFPPVFPCLLSLVWQFDEAFPKNLPLLAAVPLLSGAAGLGLAVGCVERQVNVPLAGAATAILLSASTSGLPSLFISVMSEGTYLFLSMLLLIALHRPQPAGGRPVRWVGVLVVLFLLTFYTRLVGVSLLVAGGAWLAISGDRRAACLYVSIGGLLGPLLWFGWVRSHAPVPTGPVDPVANAYASYASMFIAGLDPGEYVCSLPQRLGFFLSALTQNLFPWSVFMAGWLCIGAGAAVATALATRALDPLVASWAERKVSSSRFSPSGLYLAAYAATVVLIAPVDGMRRFVAVVIPLVWAYLIRSALEFIARAPRSLMATRLVPCALYVGLAATAWPQAATSYRLLHRSREEQWVDTGQHPELWEEYQAMFAYIEANVPDVAIIAAPSDVVVFLYSGRSTVYLSYASFPSEASFLSRTAASDLLSGLRREGVTHLLAEPEYRGREVVAPVNSVEKGLIAAFPSEFALEHVSPRGRLTLYRVIAPTDAHDDPPQDRPRATGR